MKESVRNVFISHHSKDDKSIDSMTSNLARKGFNLRNSSIRLKDRNKSRVESDQVSERTIKRLLSMKMRWAGKIIVIIGKETHQRKWVNWEIETAIKQGKEIIGVYQDKLEGDIHIPTQLEDYANSIVSWDTESIISALDGYPIFQRPDGKPSPQLEGISLSC